MKHIKLEKADYLIRLTVSNCIIHLVPNCLVIYYKESNDPNRPLTIKGRDSWIHITEKEADYIYSEFKKLNNI